MQESLLQQSLVGVVWSFMVSIFAIPSIIRLAYDKRLLDAPNGRTVHTSLTPRLGGLAIFAGFMSSITIFGSFSGQSAEFQKVLAGCVILFFIGLKDDIVPVSVAKKFFGQVLAAGVVVFAGDIRVTDLHGFLGVHTLDIGTSYCLSLLLIIGVTNSINLIDGLDGLAGVLLLVALLFFGGYFIWKGSPYGVLAFCLAGGIIGFLRYNLHRARIFMGDTGSLLGGFIVSILVIKFLELTPGVNNSPAIVFSVLVVPVVDTLKVFLLRIISGRSPFSPDKWHIHHRLLDLGLSQLVVVGLLFVFNLLMIGVAFLLSFMELHVLLGIEISIVLLVLGLVEFPSVRNEFLKVGKV